MPATPGVTITGKLIDAEGNADAGSVVITLATSVTPLVVGLGWITAAPIVVQAAVDGTFSATIFGNYQISPANTYYSIGFRSAGSSAVNFTGRYQFNSAGTYDITSVSPYTGSGTNLTVNGIVAQSNGILTVNGS